MNFFGWISAIVVAYMLLFTNGEVRWKHTDGGEWSSVKWIPLFQVVTKEK